MQHTYLDAAENCGENGMPSRRTWLCFLYKENMSI